MTAFPQPKIISQIDYHANSHALVIPLTQGIFLAHHQTPRIQTNPLCCRIEGFSSPVTFALFRPASGRFHGNGGATTTSHWPRSLVLRIESSSLSSIARFLALFQLFAFVTHLQGQVSRISQRRILSGI